MKFVVVHAALICIALYIISIQCYFKPLTPRITTRGSEFRGAQTIRMVRQFVKLTFLAWTNIARSEKVTQHDLYAELPDVETSSSPSVNGIIFAPEFLRYVDSPVCIPSMADFSLTNAHKEDIQLLSVISDDTQFYPVLFQPQSLKVNTSISIQLLFLPYYVDSSEATLTIVSSIGKHIYKIYGRSVGNPYHLHPLTGFRVPAGVPYEQSVVMYNPHNEVLHIREIFTTEDFLSIKGASSGSHENSRDTFSRRIQLPEEQEKTKFGIWEIPPGEEKQLVTISMLSTMPGSYNGYVHIKTDRENIVLPIDMTVLEGGLFPTPEIVDFGLIQSLQEIKTIPFYILNGGSKPLQIQNILPVNPDQNLQITIQNWTLQPGVDTLVCHLSYSSTKEIHVKDKFLVITNNSNPALATLEVTYFVSVNEWASGSDADIIFVLPVKTKYSISRDFLLKKLPDETHDAVENRRTYDFYDDEIGAYPTTYKVQKSLYTFNDYEATATILSIKSIGCSDILSVRKWPETLVVEPKQSWGPIIIEADLARALATMKNDQPVNCPLRFDSDQVSYELPVMFIAGNLKYTRFATKFLHEYDFDQVVEERKIDTTASISMSTLESERYEIHQFKNVETISVDVGYLSTTSPRPIDLHFRNDDPISMTLSFPFVSHSIKVCLNRDMNMSSFQTKPTIPIGECILYTDSVPITYFNVSRRYAYEFRIFLTGDEFSKCPENIVCYVRFDLETEYQYTRFIVYYRVTAGIMTLVPVQTAEPLGHLVIGVHAPMLFEVHSTYPIPMENFVWGIKEAHLYQVGLTIQQLPLPSPSDTSQSQMSKLLMVVNPIYHVLPNAYAAHIYSQALQFLNILGNPDYGELSLAFTVYLNCLINNDFFSAFEMKQFALNKFKYQYGSGILLPDLFITLSADYSEHTVILHNTTVRLPTELFPDFYSVEFPALKLDNMAVFYFEIFNPFDTFVNFSIAETVSFLHPDELLHLRASNQVILPVQQVFLEDDPKNDHRTTRTFHYLEFNTMMYDVQKLNPMLTAVVSLTTQAIVVPPKKGAILGPNLFLPALLTPETPNEMTIFLKNNFTGIEKLQLIIHDGYPNYKLNLISLINSTVKDPDAVESVVLYPLCNNTLIPSVVHAFRTPKYCREDFGNNDDVYTVTVSNHYSLLRFVVINIGKNEIQLDTFIISGNYSHSQIFMQIEDDLTSTGTTIQPSQSIEIFVRALSDCRTIWEDSVLEISSSMSFVPKIKVLLKYSMSDETKQMCLEESYSEFIKLVLQIIVLTILVIVIREIYAGLRMISIERARRKLIHYEIKKKLSSSTGANPDSGVIQANTSLSFGLGEPLESYIRTKTLLPPPVQYLPKSVTLCDVDNPFLESPALSAVEALLKRRREGLTDTLKSFVVVDSPVSKHKSSDLENKKGGSKTSGSKSKNSKPKEISDSTPPLTVEIPSIVTEPKFVVSESSVATHGANYSPYHRSAHGNTPRSTDPVFSGSLSKAFDSFSIDDSFSSADHFSSSPSNLFGGSRGQFDLSRKDTNVSLYQDDDFDLFAGESASIQSILNDIMSPRKSDAFSSVSDPGDPFHNLGGQPSTHYSPFTSGTIVPPPGLGPTTLGWGSEVFSPSTFPVQERQQQSPSFSVEGKCGWDQGLSFSLDRITTDDAPLSFLRGNSQDQELSFGDLGGAHHHSTANGVQSRISQVPSFFGADSFFGSLPSSSSSGGMILEIDLTGGDIGNDDDVSNIYK